MLWHLKTFLISSDALAFRTVTCSWEKKLQTTVWNCSKCSVLGLNLIHFMAENKVTWRRELTETEEIECRTTEVRQNITHFKRWITFMQKICTASLHTVQCKVRWRWFFQCLLFYGIVVSVCAGKPDRWISHVCAVWSSQFTQCNILQSSCDAVRLFLCHLLNASVVYCKSVFATSFWFVHMHVEFCRHLAASATVVYI